jgi:hypothetical protein
MFKNSLKVKILTLFTLIGILSWNITPFLYPPRAEAAVLKAEKFLPGVAKGFLTGATACLAQVGAVWLLGKGVSQAERVESVPVATGAGNSQFASSSGKEFCLDAIASNMAKATLEKFTKSTVAWINSGFEGDPLYVRDPKSFFKGIAQEQIGSITLSIEMSGAPFARSLAQSLILSQVDDFQAAMKYNIDSYLGSTRTDQYQLDFAAGGWEAWLLQTQYPQNNHIGASINVANRTTKQLAGTDKSIGEIAQEEINQGAGFLGLKECVDPIDWVRGTGFVPPSYADPFAGMTPDEFAALTPQERAQIENDASNAYLEQVAEERAEYEKKSTCKRWETRTPGKAIADQLQTAMGSSFRQTELADELNESIAVIFDSLVSHFLTEGLNALGDDSGSSTNYSQSGFAGYGTNSSAGGTYTNGAWISQTTPQSIYSVWTDTDKLLGWQNDYLVVLDQKKAIISNQILPKLYELDFCVPGPRQDWVDRAREKVSAALPGLDDYYSTSPFFASLFITIDSSNIDDLENGAGATMLQSMFDQYTTLLNDRWFSQNSLLQLPTINSINQSEYKKIAQYKDEISSIDQEIIETRSVISRLNYIKQQLQGIPNPNTGGVLTQTQQDTANQQQRVLDQISLLVATDESKDVVVDEIADFQSVLAYIGDSTKGLIKQCMDEVNTMTNPGLKIRFAYPVSLVPASIQNTYTPGPMITAYEPGSGELREPTYLKNIPTATSFNTYISYGTGPNCTPTAPYIHISSFINLADCDSTAGFERFIEIY